MLKLISLLPLIFAPLLSINNPVLKANDNSNLILEVNERGNYTVTGVYDSFTTSEEIRIYNQNDLIIDEIKDGAFDNCLNLESLMITRSIKYVTDLAFVDTITTLNFTGSEVEYASLNLTKQFESLNYYACDEGFINYWNDNVRPSKGISICDMTKDDFQKLYKLYQNLTISDRKNVNDAVDVEGEKIGESMNVLIDQFKAPQSSNNKTSEWKQSGAITFIIIVAVIGMTSICVFFLMKTKQIIS